MKNEEIEKFINEHDLNAPRVKLDSLEELIVAEEYHVFFGTTVTVCCLRLKNGFTVTGESACVSPENFNEELGRLIARDRAKDKMWALEGYLLAQRLYEQGLING